MEFIFYTNKSGRSAIQKYLKGKSQEFNRQFRRTLQRLQNHPELMDKKHLKNGIYELRIWPGGQVCRPLYAYIVKDRCLILHVIDHMDGKAQDKAVETALARLKDWNS